MSTPKPSIFSPSDEPPFVALKYDDDDVTCRLPTLREILEALSASREIMSALWWMKNSSNFSQQASQNQNSQILKLRFHTSAMMPKLLIFLLLSVVSSFTPTLLSPLRSLPHAVRRESVAARSPFQIRRSFLQAEPSLEEIENLSFKGKGGGGSEEGRRERSRRRL